MPEQASKSVSSFLFGKAHAFFAPAELTNQYLQINASGYVVIDYVVSSKFLRFHINLQAF